MLPEVQRFHNWLRRRSPHASTAHHYSRDLELFFAWLGRGRGAASDGHGQESGDVREPVCAGLIAGSALVGIADILLKVFLK